MLSHSPKSPLGPGLVFLMPHTGCYLRQLILVCLQSTNWQNFIIMLPRPLPSTLKGATFSIREQDRQTKIHKRKGRKLSFFLSVLIF